ncbi:hypothetical protein COV13_02575 [Candidatus Woesearchaeota archaeon CG10_big_fil_rev_8_21_14_0_10_32_9]|nr:MAG: hypothetical protein COV13_02575 [Candidatus Woesearchaeota archaeon CG10_big_fil_rev_8_21_14_0_10_32_9]
MLGPIEIIQSVIYFVSLYYVVFWLLVLFDAPEKDEKRKNKEWPEISILVPAYNEERNIVATLKATHDLDYPRDKVKLFFIDDGSSDKTLEKGTKYLNTLIEKKEYSDIRIITQKNGGKYSALNNALKYVDTELFATLDADSMPETDALKKIVEKFDDPEIGAVSPVLKVYNPKNYLQKIQWFEYAVNHFYKSIICKLNAIHVTPGPLSTYRTKVVRRIGYFREAHKTEDMEMAMRIQKAHYRIIQANDAFVYTKAPNTIKALYKQRHRWNLGTFKNLIDYRKMMFNRKYGDFGLFQLPVILISGLLGVVVISLVVNELWKSLRHTYNMLKLFNFNILDYMRTLKFDIMLYDVDLRTTATFVIFLALSILVIWLSLKVYRERFLIKRIISFVLYFFLYYLFLGIVWLGVFKDVMLGRGSDWKK